MSSFKKQCLTFFSTIFFSSHAIAAPALQLDSTEDTPVGFSYKNKWFAIKTTNTNAVLELLKPNQLTKANWASGIKLAYSHDFTDKKQYPVFITPPVNGWTFVVGNNLPYPYRTDNKIAKKINDSFFDLFSKLYSHFDEVQFFGSYRVVDFESWAKASDGKMIRAFSYADGSVYANIGQQSKEEKELNLLDLSGLSTEDATNKIFEQAEVRYQSEERAHSINQAINHKNQIRDIPTEGDATDIANLWSLDPTNLPDFYQTKGVGFIGFLPQ